jgi:hypothetical protein
LVAGDLKTLLKQVQQAYLWYLINALIGFPLANICSRIPLDMDEHLFVVMDGVTRLESPERGIVLQGLIRTTIFSDLKDGWR